MLFGRSGCNVAWLTGLGEGHSWKQEMNSKAGVLEGRGWGYTKRQKWKEAMDREKSGQTVKRRDLSTDLVTTWMWGGGAKKGQPSQLCKHQVFVASSPAQS